MKNTTDIGLLLFRAGFGLYMLFGHGWGKMLKLFAGDFQFASVLGMPESISLGLAVFGEALCCMLIIVGFKTRLAAIPAAITMFVAAFVAHASDPWFASNANGGGSKEMAMLYFIAFASIALLGAGKYSLDGINKGK